LIASSLKNSRNSIEPGPHTVEACGDAHASPPDLL
jgi:hypothetical protein